MAETDKGLEKAIDDHLKRLQERYKANIKVFNATHIGHISLAIVFLISILFPFLYLQVDTRKVNLEILISGYADNQMAAEARKIDVDAVLEKPFTLESLFNILKEKIEDRKVSNGFSGNVVATRTETPNTNTMSERTKGGKKWDYLIFSKTWVKKYSAAKRRRPRKSRRTSKLPIPASMTSTWLTMTVSSS